MVPPPSARVDWLMMTVHKIGGGDEVTREQLLAGWEGRDPRTGEILARRSARRRACRRGGLHLLRPKSISVGRVVEAGAGEARSAGLVELDHARGEVVRVVDWGAGWLWCRSAGGACAWVDAESLKPLDEGIPCSD